VDVSIDHSLLRESSLHLTLELFKIPNENFEQFLKNIMPGLIKNLSEERIKSRKFAKRILEEYIIEDFD